MIIQPDLIVFNLVNAAFKNISQNVAVLADIFAGHDSAEINDIQRWFSQNIVKVNWGWARQPPEAGIGAVYISTESAKEFGPYQFIGQEALGVEADDTNLIDKLGNYVESNTKLTCISTNNSKTGYLAALIKYILFLNRINLEQNFGLQEQALSLSPLIPEPRLDPDIFVFRRDVVLNCKHLDITNIAEIGLRIIRTIIINPESVDPNFNFTIH